MQIQDLKLIKNSIFSTKFILLLLIQILSIQELKAQEWEYKKIDGQFQENLNLEPHPKWQKIEVKKENYQQQIIWDKIEIKKDLPS